MANTEIANLTAGTSPTGLELVHAIQGGNSRKLTVLELAMASQAVLAFQATPPGGPTLGDKYVVTATATGAWAGQENDLAIYNGSTWDFYTPVEGWILYDQGANARMQFTSSWAEFTGGGGGSLPAGGTTGQVLKKQSGTDGDADWEDESYIASGVQVPYAEFVTEITDLTSAIEIDISSYDRVDIFIEGASTSSTDPARITLSDDAGSTYESSYPTTSVTDGATEAEATDTSIAIMIASSASETQRGWISIDGIQDSTVATVVHGWFGHSTSNIQKTSFAAAVTHNKLKVDIASGNLDAGTIRVVGIRHGNVTYIGSQNRAVALTVTNPGFEAGALTGWTVVGNSPSVETRIGGTGTWSSLLGSEWGTYVLAGGSVASSGVYQDIDVSAYSSTAESYTCGSWIAQDDSGTNDVVTVTFELLDSGDSVINSVTKTLGQSAGTTDTSDLTLPGDPTGVTVRINVDFTRGGSGTYINACADMFSVTANVVDGIELGVTFFEKTASFSVENAHLYGGGYIDVNSASAVVVTVPPDLFGLQPCVFERVNTGSVTFSAGSGVTINSKDSLLAIADRYTSVTLIPKGSNVYSLQGNLA